MGFYRVSIYINVSLGDVSVVCVFWKVLTSLKSIYPSSTSIRRVMPCFIKVFQCPKVRLATKSAEVVSSATAGEPCLQLCLQKSRQKVSQTKIWDW